MVVAMQPWVKRTGCAASVFQSARLPGNIWLVRIVAGEAAVLMGTEARGASNAKARRAWRPRRLASWRRRQACSSRREAERRVGVGGEGEDQAEGHREPVAG